MRVRVILTGDQATGQTEPIDQRQVLFQQIQVGIRCFRTHSRARTAAPPVLLQALLHLVLNHALFPPVLRVQTQRYFNLEKKKKTTSF